jgi:hypothetical protein
MVPEECDDPAPSAEVDHGLDSLPAIGTAAYVVAEKDHRVVLTGLNESKEPRQGIGVAVDVAYGDGAGTTTKHA